MWNDPIVEETRRIRGELAAKFNYDLQEIGQHYIADQKSEDQEIVRRPTKKAKEEKEKVA